MNYANQRCADPLDQPCKKREQRRKEEVNGDLGIKGDAYIKGDLFLNGNLVYRNECPSVLPPAFNGIIAFRGCQLVRQGATYFLPSGSLDPVAGLFFDAAFIQRNIGKSLTFVVAPSGSSDTLVGATTIYSAYLGVSGDPTIRTVTLSSTSNYVFDVIILETQVGPLVVIEQPRALVAPVIGAPAAVAPINTNFGL